MNQSCQRLVCNPRRRAALCVVLLGVAGGSVGYGQRAASDSPGNVVPPGQNTSESELAAIRAGAQAFVAAFNRRDAKAVAALWTKNGEYIDESGRRFLGREAIEQSYSEFFANSPKVTLRVMIDSLRLLNDGTAIEEGRAVVDPLPAGGLTYGKYAAVHIKVDGKWRMASVRDMRVETSPAHNNVADLDWLIGTWIAEEHGHLCQSTCRWVASNNFVERKYTVTHADGTKVSGVQLIGWNPLDGHLQSWDFSPGGGHAIGVWTPRQGGWMAETRGATGDGTPTTSVNVLTRLDDNAYVWQSVRRTAGGIALPDTDEVVLKRQPATQ